MQFWEKFRSVSSYLTILRRKNIIVSLYHAILRKKSELQEKKSELWDKTLQLPF